MEAPETNWREEDGVDDSSSSDEVSAPYCVVLVNYNTTVGQDSHG